MVTKQVSVAALAASLALTPATQVAADAGDALAGALVGGIIGHAIGRDQQRQRQQQSRTVYRKPAVSSATREANREIQTSLNYFGFPAGAPDGALGPRSRGAISQYQATLGYPVTGQLTQYERDFLVGSYHRAIAGGAATAQLLASMPQGSRGLLLRYRDEAAGVAVVAPVAPAPTLAVPGGTTVVVAPQAATGTRTTTVTEVSSAELVEPAPTGSALPTFMGGGDALSLASHCNQVALLTSSNGGFTTEATLTDAAFALGEQFCLARTYAIAEGEALAERIEGYTAAEIAEQCKAFGPALGDEVKALSLKPRDEVLREVSSFALASGMAPAELAGTAKVCLSVGYRTDDLDVALGSALLLVALGEPVYGELMGHHLSQGFGASKRTDLALPWYEMGLDAIEAGAPAVFAPGQPDRNALIRKAAFGTAPGDAPAQDMMAAPVSTLPTFVVDR